LFLLGVLMLASCQRAQKYAPVAKAAPEKIDTKDDEAERGLYRLSWRAPRERHDLPIVFVTESETDPEWANLKGYWNTLPFPAGMPTAHLGLVLPSAAVMGLPEINALAALVVTEHSSAVKIKVP